ncbi:hypothetical protein F4802DRAFT_111568 [Xylaria palmicola]|nr:hypothetical protein F4802DRAFT_111568 [Xylaria palmicola]
MTTTTTVNTTTRSLSDVLSDYELHISSPPREGVDSSNDVDPHQVRGIQNPANWPTNHRRVPPYRPVDYDLDLSQRIVFQNNFERGFINAMFFGLRLVTVSCQLTGVCRLDRRLTRSALNSWPIGHGVSPGRGSMINTFNTKLAANTRGMNGFLIMAPACVPMK